MTADGFRHIPPEEFKTLNALEGFGQNALPPSAALAAQELEVSFDEDGTQRQTRYSFHGADALTWRSEAGDGGDERYDAREVVPGILLVCFSEAQRPERARVLVIDTERAIVTRVTSTVVGDDASGRDVEEVFSHGRLPGAAEGDHHPRTDELVGHRFQYTYSPHDAYEHVYLTPSTYAWHCLAGEEQGQADCDRALAYKLRERVYLLAWHENVVPCDGIVVLDWVGMRNNGRIFGWDTGARAYNSIRMGAIAAPLNFTRYVPLGG
ncbi:MAG: MoaF C-terminal domain-containing protein [Solirubrobacteraceae bacterium]